MSVKGSVAIEYATIGWYGGFAGCEKPIYVDDRLWDGQMIDQQQLDSVGKMGGDFYSLSTDLRKLARPVVTPADEPKKGG